MRCPTHLSVGQEAIAAASGLALKKKDISMANADEVKTITGFSIGGVAPVAHTKKMNILIDWCRKYFRKRISRYKK